MFGDNQDVLPPGNVPRGGFVGYSGGGAFRARTAGEQIAAIELSLDFAILEDGLCVGPDESELFENLAEELERQCNTAQEVVAALRNGALAGQVFEILRPFARDTPPPAPSVRRQAPFANLFGHMAMRQLVNGSDADLLAWFERAAQPPTLRLHRPS